MFFTYSLFFRQHIYSVGLPEIPGVLERMLVQMIEPRESGPSVIV